MNRKSEHIDTAKELFADTNISITIDGRKHLGAAIGTDEYRDKYVAERLEKLKGELQLLSRIANIDPQAAYCCFVKGFKNKFSYMMRTIPKISNLLKSIDDVVTTQFIPAITGGIYVNQEQRRLLSLPVKLGGLAIPIFSDISDNEFSFSVKISENHVNGILAQQRKYTKDSEMAAKKNDIKKMKKELNERILSEISKTLSTEDSRLLQLSMENGASTWLSTLPLAEEGYHLTKQNFWDLIRFRYGWQLSRLPGTCECGSSFSIDHALSCKKGGFISLRHNEIRNVTANLLSEFCQLFYL